MSRGAQQQFQNQQAINAQLIGGATTAAGNIGAQATNIPADLTPEQKEAIIRAQLGGIDIGTQGSEQRAQRFAARTGAIAGAPELQADIARKGTEDKATAAGKLEQYFANVPVQRAQDIANIYGKQAGVYEGMYGPSAGLAGKLAEEAYKPNPWLMQMLKGAQMGAAAMGGEA